MPGVVLEARATKVNLMDSLSLEFFRTWVGWTGLPSCHPHMKRRTLKERGLCRGKESCNVELRYSRGRWWAAGVACGLWAAGGRKWGYDDLPTRVCLGAPSLSKGSGGGGVASQDSCFFQTMSITTILRMTTVYVRLLSSKVRANSLKCFYGWIFQKVPRPEGLFQKKNWYSKFVFLPHLKIQKKEKEQRKLFLQQCKVTKI